LAVWALSGYNLASAGARVEADGRGAARPVVRKRGDDVAPGHRAGGPLDRPDDRGGHRARGRRLRRARPGAVAPAKTHRAPRAPSTDPTAVAARANVPVLCWHQIRQPTSADSAGARPYIVSPRRLAEQLDALDLGALHRGRRRCARRPCPRGTPLPHKPVLLTFDDGSAGQYTRALPLLRRHHLVATFFVMTVVLAKPGWLSRAEVRALDHAGMTIAAHTWDHHPVTQYTAADWPRQLIEPRDELAGIVGHPVRLFAYPDGLWSPTAFPYLQRGSFTAAFQLAGKLDAADPRWTLRRSSSPRRPERSFCAPSAETSDPAPARRGHRRPLRPRRSRDGVSANRAAHGTPAMWGRA
jgi:peptidoglycan/xylan/chitin deacetylase (PgdA/CDA1 family)